MTTDEPTYGAAVEGVMFDFHHTLVDQGDAGEWLDRAWATAGRPGTPGGPEGGGGLGHEGAMAMVAFLDRVWEHSRDVDPENRRDHDPTTHREVFHATMQLLDLGDEDLHDALYETLLDTWRPYADTLPVLGALRAAGVRTVVLSNVGIDLAPVLDRSGISAAVDGVILSYQVGHVKPEPEIFQKALGVLDVPAERALMVGDSWKDDPAAAAIGIRSLVLPRTRGDHHGLGIVLRLIGR